MQQYESVIIFDVQVTDSVRDAVLAEVGGIVTGSGGAVREVVPFGVRPLSFEIKGRTRGDYRIVRFAAAADSLQKMDRLLRLKEEVLRHMVTRYFPPKPRKESPRKKKAATEQVESEGEVSHGKSEQGSLGRQPDAPAGA